MLRVLQAVPLGESWCGGGVGPVAGPFRYGVSTYSYTGDMNTLMTLDDAMAEIADVGATGIELLSEGNMRVPAADLLDIAPYVVFVQAKFYEVDEQLHDLHIPWLDVLRALRDGGYDGWLSSEYEGRRVPDRGKAMVRRQHAMFHELAAQL